LIHWEEVMAFLRNKLALFAAIVFLAWGAGFSQVETGQIAGTVKDQAGAAFPARQSTSKRSRRMSSAIASPARTANI
jgi:hypothetical protein